MLVVTDIQMHLNIIINILLNYILQLISIGGHSCLWCTIIALEMKLPRDERSPTILRTLENLHEQCQKFLDAGGDIKKAKNYFNVIHKAIFDIPIEQVSNRKFFSKIF